MTISDADIEREQAELRVTFPAALAARLRRENGGEPVVATTSRFSRCWSVRPAR